MRHVPVFKTAFGIAACIAAAVSPATAFEGRLRAVTVQGNVTSALLYTVGTNSVRIEVMATNWPNPIDIVDLESGATTLLFPHNRSFVRLPAAGGNLAGRLPGRQTMSLPPGIGPQSAATPGVPAMPAPPAGWPQGNVPNHANPPNMPAMPLPPGGLPPGIGPQPAGSAGTPKMPAMPGIAGGMPMMPVSPMEKAELKATGETTNLLGYACARYELKQRDETLEVWATDRLFPYQPYLRNQLPRYVARRAEEKWPELLGARKLFPLLAHLRQDSGRETLRFEVTSITPDKIADTEGTLFQPPPDYHEMQPLPN